MILISDRSQFASILIDKYGGALYRGKDGTTYVVAGIGKTVAVWRDSVTKTYTDSEGKKTKRTVLSHYAAILNDLGNVVPLCYHRNIVPESNYDPLHGTHKAQVSAPLADVVAVEKRIAAEIASTLMLGAGQTIVQSTFRYGDRVLLLDTPDTGKGKDYRFITKSLIEKGQMKIGTTDTKGLVNNLNPLFIDGNKVRNLRLAPTYSDEFLGIAEMIVEAIGIEGYYRDPLNVRDICRAMTRYYIDKHKLEQYKLPFKSSAGTSGTLTTTSAPTKKTKKTKTYKTLGDLPSAPVAGSEIAEGIETNGKPTVDARGNTQDSEPIAAGVDPANAAGQVATALQNGNGATL